LAADEQRARERSAPVEGQFEDLPDHEVWHDNNFIDESPSDWRSSSVDKGDLSDEELDIFGDEFEDQEDLDKDDEGVANPCPELPGLFDDQQKIVEKWIDEFPNHYEKKNPDDAIARIRQFMNEHPDLFPYLYLEESALFELGAELARRKQWSKYIDLLKEIRQKHPQMYQRGFEYFDQDLILDAIVTGNSVSSYFDFFRKFPQHNPDKVFEIINLLAWTNKEKELLEFVEITSGERWYLPYEIYEESELYWPIFVEQIQRMDSTDALDLIAEQIAALFEPRTRKVFTDSQKLAIRQGIEWVSTAQSDWDVTQYKDLRGIHDFYQALAWHFCAFLHHTKGIGWIKSRYLANRLLDYWTDIPERKRPKKTFRVNEAQIDRHIAVRYRMFFCVDGVRGAGLIEAVYHFADFLAVHGHQAEESTEEIHALCGRLHARLLKAVEPTDPILQLAPEFPPRY
jgi:hypothetical protein